MGALREDQWDVLEIEIPSFGFSLPLRATAALPSFGVVSSFEGCFTGYFRLFWPSGLLPAPGRAGPGGSFLADSHLCRSEV